MQVLLQILVLLFELIYLGGRSFHSGGGGFGYLLYGGDLLGVRGDSASHLPFNPAHGCPVVHQLLAYLGEFGVKHSDEVLVFRHGAAARKIRVIQTFARLLFVLTMPAAERFAYCAC